MLVCKKCIILVSLLILNYAIAQTKYTGFIDKYPIELYLYPISTTGSANGIYVYTKHSTPININGERFKSSLTLYETDKTKTKTGEFTFEKFNESQTEITGVWKNLKTNKILNVTLKKEFSLNEDNLKKEYERELLQFNTTNKFYFKLQLKKTKEDDSFTISSINVYKKKSDSLIQKFEVGTDNLAIGFHNISTADYNFDGITDFSIITEISSGGNTSSNYYLFDSVTNQFILANFDGTNLEFNPSTKIVTSTNTCCGGQIEIIKYKVVNNQLVQIKN